MPSTEKVGALWVNAEFGLWKGYPIVDNMNTSLLRTMLWQADELLDTPIVSNMVVPKHAFRDSLLQQPKPCMKVFKELYISQTVSNTQAVQSLASAYRGSILAPEGRPSPQDVPWVSGAQMSDSEIAVLDVGASTRMTWSGTVHSIVHHPRCIISHADLSKSFVRYYTGSILTCARYNDACHAPAIWTTWLVVLDPIPRMMPQSFETIHMFQPRPPGASYRWKRLAYLPSLR